MKKKLKFNIGILLGVFAIILRFLLPNSFIESYYSRGLFLKIRLLLDSISPKLPFAGFYLFIIGVVFGLIFCLRHFFKKEPLFLKIKKSSLSILNFLGLLIFLFLTLWGFNYKRLPLETQMNLSKENLSLIEIKNELEYQSAVISQMRNSVLELQSDSTIIAAINITEPLNLQEQVRNALLEVLEKYDFPTVGIVNLRELRPKGLLFRFNSSGVYLPFSGEGHVESALHPLQRPFVMAHEMAHGYGFADEGACNFWAYLACIHSYNSFVRYSGHLAYWRYLASAYKRAEPELYDKFRVGLPIEIQTDLNSINDRLTSYPGLFGNSNIVYDSFLKAQGVDEGLNNYDKIIPLVKSYWDNMREENQSVKFFN